MGEHPHGGDDAVIGGWTFSHFMLKMGERRKKEQYTTYFEINKVVRHPARGGPKYPTGVMTQSSGVGHFLIF